ncbi:MULTISPECIES: class I SAM-dependent DNA methyltransferase [unclassified Halobacteriovorax]|uniref:HsdM family class I SAM-dependent methyltransferase n=1 Tax=unclassified Halobacteriovorax TaxID=2639665 RepID=UPI00399C1675
MTKKFEIQTKELIDGLKSVCANYGLGNDGNEFKIITQVFLYKFLNDKFIYEVKKNDEKALESESVEAYISSLSKDDYEMLCMQLGESTAILKPEQLISKLYQKQDTSDFSDLFDSTLMEIAKNNSDIFSVLTNDGKKIVLFENISKYVTDKKDEFCKAVINKLTNFSFEHIFEEKYDFFATIFEYLIKDYNSNSGGKYAEYFTPHAVAKIMAKCLVQDEVSNVTCYDPSAGSGTLLMNLAHEIGEDKCSIFSQDISQKSSGLLRLNLILNNLVHSIHNIVTGNTILEPYHKSENGKLKQFDYIVSNPPFKLDFSGYVHQLDSKENSERFFAGFPNIPKKDKDKMAIYPLFVQHVIHSLSSSGKAAIVVPTGFIATQSKIEKKIRKKLVDEKMLKGVVSMPSNIFASTGTNVSILFIDKNDNSDSVVLIDASELGEKVKEGKNQKTVLKKEEEDRIINCFNNKVEEDDFSAVVNYSDMEPKDYSFSAGQYFKIKVDFVEISEEEFLDENKNKIEKLTELFRESHSLDSEILKQLGKLKYEN